jgi:iron-sulfur cluster repair protein YtfE (RIC family)
MATGTTTDPISLIKADHRRVEQLFTKIEKAEGEKRQPLVDQLIAELAVHMQIEEDKLYPIVEREVDAEMAQEANTEHELARTGLEQLRSLAPDEPGFGAALDMVRAGIEHHVEEEESELLPQLRQKLNTTELAELGTELTALKAQLMEAGPELRTAGGRGRGGARGRGRGRRDGGPTRAQLLERAKKQGLSGYSRMTKDELSKALTPA